MGDCGVVRHGPVGFDLDMTLIDSRPSILESFAALAAETGTAIDLDAVDRRLGLKLEDELTYWFPDGELVTAAGIFRRHYVELAAGWTTVMPGAHEALATVRAAGEASAIITAKHQISVAPCLAATGLRADHVFTHVHGPEKATVLTQIGAAAYVGDTPADMAAATDAGTVGLGVATGSFGADALLAAGAATVLGSLEEFAAWYELGRNGQSRSRRGHRGRLTGRGTS
jgi:phosphoglycolate phosphatase